MIKIKNFYHAKSPYTELKHLDLKNSFKNIVIKKLNKYQIKTKPLNLDLVWEFNSCNGKVDCTILAFINDNLEVFLGKGTSKGASRHHDFNIGRYVALGRAADEMIRNSYFLKNLVIHQTIWQKIRNLFRFPCDKKMR